MLECTLLPPSDQRPATLRVAGSATIAYVQQFKEALAEAVKQYPDLHVDCAEVTEADCSCLQLLCSAHRSCQTLRLTPATHQALTEVIASAGFERMQGCCLADDKNSCIWIRPDQN